MIGAALPSAALGALALGLGAGALVRLAFGSAAGVPPTAQVRDALAALGVEVEDLTPAQQQRVGYAEYVGRDADGGRSRCASSAATRRTPSGSRGAGAFSRTAIRRGAPRSAAWSRSSTRRSRLFMAAQAGVRVPEVVIAALGPEGDASS